MRILCVIPARGGSKGVPRKNLRPVAGKPLLAWTVEQALAATPAMDVVVSTEDAEIAAVAVECGASVPVLRPAELARDETPTEPVVRHALEVARSSGAPPDAVVLLQAPTPVRLPDSLTRALAQFQSSGVDSLVGVVPQSPFVWADGPEPSASYDVAARPRRQDFAPEDLRYRETGSVYVTRTWVYDEHDNRIGGRVGLFVMDEVEGIDIDTEHDLDVADAVLRRLLSDATTGTPA